MNKNFTFTVTALSGRDLKQVHTYGEVTRVEKWELRKVVTLLKQEHPECEPAGFLQQSMESYYREDDGTADSTFHRVVTPFFPYLLSWFRGKKLSQKDKACLWIVANYWYQFCGGPNPGSAPKQKKVKTEVWKQSLVCPICNTPADKKVVGNGDAEDTLERYSQWLIKHRPLCQLKFSEERALALAKSAEELHTEREQRANLYFENLQKLGKLGTEINQHLNELEKQNDKLLRERVQFNELIAAKDDKNFEIVARKAIEAINSGYQPLTEKEQWRYAYLNRAINKIEGLLDQIKGQRGVQAQRQSLQKDLQGFRKEYQVLEKRRQYAGEEP